MESEHQKQRKKRWLDNATAIILSLASVISAWFSFQSSQWNGKQTFYLDDEIIAHNKRLQKELTAAQRRAGDANFIIAFISAESNGNEEIVKQLKAWMPPHLKKAYDSWKLIDTVKDNAKHFSPLNMIEYVVPESVESIQFAEEAAKFKKLANMADDYSNSYLRLSIIVAMILFFTGLSGVTESYHIQRILLAISVSLFVLVTISSFWIPILLD